MSRHDPNPWGFASNPLGLRFLVVQNPCSALVRLHRRFRFAHKSNKDTMAAIASFGDFQVQFYQINLQNSHVALQQKIARLCVFNRLL